MNLRIVVSCFLVLTLPVLAQSGHARGISVDETMTCTGVVPPTGSLSVPLTGTGKGNIASADVNLPVLACDGSQGAPNDITLTVLPYHPKESVLYTWVDLSAAGGTPSTLCLVPPGCSTLLGLSSFFSSADVPIVAMVDVLKLKDSYGGDYEILVNYTSSPESACANLFKPITPSFTWFGKTYTFSSGVGGVVTPCDSLATNDFLFGRTGELLGYNSAPDDSGTFVLTPGLPPGWTVN